VKKYFYLKNGQQIGPFTYDELWNQKIATNTQVWYEGMREWQRADTFPEFANWFPKQNVAQIRPQQTVRRPQRRPVQQRPVKRKKSYRGIIGIAIFLIGAAIVYFYWIQNTNTTPDKNTFAQKIKTSSNKKKAQKNIQIVIPEVDENTEFSFEDYPLNPDKLGNKIATFLGTARHSFADAKLIYMEPHAEDRFQFIVDTYTEPAMKMFFQGVVPSIKYQSLTSALVLFYNPWNDVVLITDWHIFKGELFINDMELVTADYLQLDGQNIAQLAPMWTRDLEKLPIEALTDQAEKREKLFDNIWGTMTGTGTWRKLLYCLSTTDLLLQHQAIVAFRLRDQFLGLQNLIRGEELEILRKPFMPDLKKLHAETGLKTLLETGVETPGIVSENMAIFPSDTWEKSSVQAIRKVPEGAFVFVTSPRLTKTFLSFYYKFGSENELLLNRIDWCTFDNEI